MAALACPEQPVSGAAGGVRPSGKNPTGARPGNPARLRSPTLRVGGVAPDPGAQKRGLCLGAGPWARWEGPCGSGSSWGFGKTPGTREDPGDPECMRASVPAVSQMPPLGASAPADAAATTYPFPAPTRTPARPGPLPVSLTPCFLPWSSYMCASRKRLITILGPAPPRIDLGFSGVTPGPSGPGFCSHAPAPPGAPGSPPLPPPQF